MMYETLFLLLVTDLECYYCGHDDPGECNEEVPGEEIHCQMSNPEEPHYGDSCFVGHSGKLSKCIFGKNLILIIFEITKIT